MPYSQISDPRVDGLIAKIAQLESQLRQRRLPERGYTPVDLDTGLTSSNFDGDSFSTTAKTLIDLSAEFGVPAEVKAIDVLISCRDSGSAATDCFVILGPTNVVYSGRAFSCSGLANNSLSRGCSRVKCNADGDIYYQIVASGALTFDLWITIYGYWQ